MDIWGTEVQYLQAFQFGSLTLTPQKKCLSDLRDLPPTDLLPRSYHLCWQVSIYSTGLYTRDYENESRLVWVGIRGSSWNKEQIVITLMMSQDGKDLYYTSRS